MSTDTLLSLLFMSVFAFGTCLHALSGGIEGSSVLVSLAEADSKIRKRYGGELEILQDLGKNNTSITQGLGRVQFCG